jgi:DNA-binding beta-propeller fold protein YncE
MVKKIERVEKARLAASIWATLENKNKVVQANPANQTQVGCFSVGQTPWDIAYDGQYIWVTNVGDGTVSKLLNGIRYIPDTPECAGIPPKPIPLGLAFDAANMWVSCPNVNAVGKM